MADSRRKESLNTEQDKAAAHKEFLGNNFIYELLSNLMCHSGHVLTANILFYLIITSI